MNTSPAINTWHNCLKPNSNAKVRLFCFPYAGAGLFHSWKKNGSIDTEVRNLSEGAATPHPSANKTFDKLSGGIYDSRFD